MNTSRRGEIITLITTAVVILIGIATFVTTTFLNKKSNKIAYKPRAEIICDNECLKMDEIPEECCYEKASPAGSVNSSGSPDDRGSQPPPAAQASTNNADQQKKDQQCYDNCYGDQDCYNTCYGDQDCYNTCMSISAPTSTSIPEPTLPPVPSAPSPVPWQNRPACPPGQGEGCFTGSDGEIHRCGNDGREYPEEIARCIVGEPEENRSICPKGVGEGCRNGHWCGNDGNWYPWLDAQCGEGGKTVVQENCPAKGCFKDAWCRGPGEPGTLYESIAMGCRLKLEIDPGTSRSNQLLSVCTKDSECASGICINNLCQQRPTSTLTCIESGYFKDKSGSCFQCVAGYPPESVICQDVSTTAVVPIDIQLAQQNIFSEDACRRIQRQKDGSCIQVDFEGKKYFRYASEEDVKKEQELAKQKKEQSAFQCQRTCEESDSGKCIVTPSGESKCVLFSSMKAAYTAVSGNTAVRKLGSGGGDQNCGGRWQKTCTSEVEKSFCTNGYKPVGDSICVPDEGYEKAQAVSTYLKTYIDNNGQINAKDISSILSNLNGSSKQYLPEITKNFCSGCSGECVYSDIQGKFACISSSDIANKYYQEGKTGQNGELYGSCGFTLGPIGSACNHEDLICNSSGKCQLTAEGSRLIANDIAMKNGLVSAAGQSVNFQYLSPDRIYDLIGKKDLVSVKEVCKSNGPSWQNGACFQCVDSQNGYITQTVTDFCADPKLAKNYASLPGSGCRQSGGYCAEGSGDMSGSDCPAGFACRSNPPDAPHADSETDGTIKTVGLGKYCDTNFTARCADGLKCWNGTCQDTTVLAYNDEYQVGSWYKAVKDIPLIGGMVAPLTILFNGDLSHSAYIRARNSQTQIEKIQAGEGITGGDTALRIFQTLDGAAKGQFFQFELDKAYAQGEVDPLSAFGMKVFSNIGTIAAGYNGEAGTNAFVEYGETAAGSQDILERLKGAAKMGGQTAFMVGDILTLGTSGLIARGGVTLTATGVKIAAGTALKEVGVRAALSGVKEVAIKKGNVVAAKVFFSEVPRAAASNVLKGAGAVLKAVDAPRAASEALVKKIPLLKAPETLAAAFVLPTAIVTQKGVGAAVKAAPILLRAAEKAPVLGRIALPIAGRLNDNIARGVTDQIVAQAVNEGKHVGPSLVRSAYGTAQKEGFQGTASEFRRIFFDRIRTPSTDAIEGSLSGVADGFMQTILNEGGALTGKRRDEYIVDLAKKRAKNAKIPVADSIAQAKGAYEAIDFARRWGMKNPDDIRAVAAIIKEAKASGVSLTREEAFEQFAKKFNGSAKETAQKAHAVVEGLLFENSALIKRPPGATDLFAAKLSGFFASGDEKLINELAQQSGFAAVKGDSLVGKNVHIEVNGKIISLEQHIDQASIDKIAIAYKRSDGGVVGIKRSGDYYISTELTSDLKWPFQPRSVATSRTLDGLLPKTSNIKEIMIGEGGTLKNAIPVDEVISGSIAKQVEWLKTLARTDKEAVRNELIARGIDQKKADNIANKMRSAKPPKQRFNWWDGIRSKPNEIEFRVKNYPRFRAGGGDSATIRQALIDAGYAVNDPRYQIDQAVARIQAAPIAQNLPPPAAPGQQLAPPPAKPPEPALPHSTTINEANDMIQQQIGKRGVKGTTDYTPSGRTDLALGTDLGISRSANEDMAVVFTNPQGHDVLVIADGMGGQAAGEVAAETMVKNITADEGQSIKKAIYQADIEIGNYNAANRANSGTTVTAATIDKNLMLTVYNAGDSPAFVYRDGHLVEVFQDDTTIRKVMGREEAFSSPTKNYITNSANGGLETIHETTYQLQKGDIVLIASDGLEYMAKTLPEYERMIKQVLSDQSLSLQQKAQMLIDLAKKGGGGDNITVILKEIK